MGVAGRKEGKDRQCELRTGMNKDTEAGNGGVGGAVQGKPTCGLLFLLLNSKPGEVRER